MITHVTNIHDAHAVYQRYLTEAILTGRLARLPHEPSPRVFAAPSIHHLLGKDIDALQRREERTCLAECLRHVYCILVAPTESFEASDTPAMRATLRDFLGAMSANATGESGGEGAAASAPAPSTLMAWIDPATMTSMAMYVHPDAEDQYSQLRQILVNVGAIMPELGGEGTRNGAGPGDAGSREAEAEAEARLTLLLRGRMLFMTDAEVDAVVSAKDEHAPERTVFKHAVMRLLLNSRTVLPPPRTYHVFITWVLRCVAIPLVRNMHAAACAVKTRDDGVCAGAISFAHTVPPCSEDDGVVGFCVYAARLSRIEAARRMLRAIMTLPSE